MSSRNLSNDSEQELETAILAALLSVFLKSGSSRIDVGAALQVAGILGDAVAKRDALLQLKERGHIDQVTPLYDGGMLVNLTPAGIVAAERASENGTEARQPTR